MSNDKAKQLAGYAAANLVQDGMKIGIGTGSTVFYFIERLIQRCSDGLKITAIATSEQSAKLAKEGGIALLTPDQLTTLDLDIDGADEIDLDKQMIKGGGGALFREKIIAKASQEMIVIVDQNKIVNRLGTHPLPVEIAFYGYRATIKKLQELHLQGHLRMKGNQFYHTDNGNLIFDIDLKSYKEDFRQLDQKILAITGVIETGFFWDLAKRVVIGYSDGQVKIKEKL